MKTTADQEHPRRAKLIHLDELTQIPNRRYFNAQFPSIWKECVEKNTPLSLLMIDVDHFKNINDTYLHEAGDEVLKKAASLMTEALTENDLLIRFAGDEFIIVLPDSDEKKAKKFGQKLVSSINKAPLGISRLPEDFHISLSVGIAIFPSHTKNQEELLIKADQALYLSKDEGRNRATVYDLEQVSRLAARKGGVRLPCKSLVHRNEILFSIKEICDENSPHFAIPLFISGPMGTGKTTLLKIVESKSFVRKKHSVIYSRCYPYFLNQPYKSITQILDLIFSLDLGLLQFIEKQNLEQIAFLLPSVRDFLEKKGWKSAPPDEKNLPNVIEMSLSRVLKHKAILICIDDLDYCDKESAHILDRVFCSESIRYKFLIATFTDSEPIRFLEDRLPEIVTKKKYKIQHIDPIDESSIHQILRYIFKGENIDPEVLSAVSLRSKGNPLFIEELIRYMNDKKIIYYEDNRWNIEENWDKKTPLTLNELIIEGIKALDKTMQEMLSHAALIGQSFNLLTLENLESKNEGEIIDILEKAKKADLLTKDRTAGEEKYMFTNKTLTSAFTDMVPEEEKKMLHLKIAEIEQALGGEYMWENLGKILSHYKMGEKISSLSHFIDRLSRAPDSAFLSQDLKEFIDESIAEKDWGREEKLSKKNVLNALLVVKYIRNAVQSISLYPKDSKIVQISAENIYSELNTILEDTPTLSYSVTSDIILINGIRPDLKEYKKNMGPFLKKLMMDLGFKGISFIRDLSQSELSSFILLLSKKHEKAKSPMDWDETLKKENIFHIILNHRIYVAVGERDIQKAEKGIVIDESPKEPTPKILPEDMKLLKELLQPGVSLDIKGKLPGTLSAEKIETFISLLEEAVQGKEIKDAKEDTEEKEVHEKTEIEDDFFESLDENLKICLEELTSDNSNRALNAADRLISAGDKAIDEIVRFITQCDNLRGRKSAFKVLKKIDPEHLTKFIPEMTGHRGPDAPIKILSLLGEETHPSVKEIIKLGLFHPETKVKREAIILLEETYHSWYKELLLEYIKDGFSIKSIRVVDSVGKLKMKEAVPFLVDHLSRKSWHRREDDILLQSQMCKTLGEINTPEAVEALIAVAQTPPFWQGKNTTHIKIRISAIQALGEVCQGNPDIISTLQRISKDKNIELKDAALTVLQKINVS